MYRARTFEYIPTSENSTYQQFVMYWNALIHFRRVVFCGLLLLSSFAWHFIFPLFSHLPEYSSGLNFEPDVWVFQRGEGGGRHFLITVGRRISVDLVANAPAVNKLKKRPAPPESRNSLQFHFFPWGKTSAWPIHPRTIHDDPQLGLPDNGPGPSTGYDPFQRKLMSKRKHAPHWLKPY